VANINKGSSQPNKIIVGHVINFQLEEIANIKMQYLNTKNLITAKKIVEGITKNMGIQISK
jgi:large subunit ribosomal protein L11